MIATDTKNYSGLEGLGQKQAEVVEAAPTSGEGYSLPLSVIKEPALLPLPTPEQLTELARLKELRDIAWSHFNPGAPSSHANDWPAFAHVSGNYCAYYRRLYGRYPTDDNDPVGQAATNYHNAIRYPPPKEEKPKTDVERSKTNEQRRSTKSYDAKYDKVFKALKGHIKLVKRGDCPACVKPLGSNNLEGIPDFDGKMFIFHKACLDKLMKRGT